MAALIRGMAAAGAPPEAIALAVDAIEAREAVIEQRRAVERDRKRRQRSRDKDGTVAGRSRDTAGTVTDDTPAPAPSPSFPPDPQTNPAPTHTPAITTRTRGAAWPVPEGVNADHWRDLLANRKSKRLTNTPTAHKQLLATLADLADDEWPPGRIVEFAAGRGWGAIFDPRKHEQRNGQRSHHYRSEGDDHPGGRIGASADRVFGRMV